MADREAWLAQTTEAAREPELALCDPHHHLWDHPGNRYLADEFTRDLAGGHRVRSTVFVECVQFYDHAAPAALQPVGETRFVDQLAATGFAGHPTRVAAGIVGFADLGRGAGVAKVLEAHLAASGRFRGVRHASAWHPSQQVHNAHTHPPEGLLAEPEFRRGFACLEPLGLSFDAWVYHPQLPELADLARAFPGTRIVLDHMAGPLGIGPYAERREEVFGQWRAGLAELARCANVSVKLGGRAMTNAGFGWHRREQPPGSAELAGAWAPYFHACIELFGPARCMFESNFPVEKASVSYTVLWNAFKRVSEAYSTAERAALLHDSAARFYRLAA